MWNTLSPLILLVLTISNVVFGVICYKEGFEFLDSDSIFYDFKVKVLAVASLVFSIAFGVIIQIGTGIGSDEVWVNRNTGVVAEGHGNLLWTLIIIAIHSFACWGIAFIIAKIFKLKN